MLERLVDDHVHHIGPGKAPGMSPSPLSPGGQHQCPTTGSLQVLCCEEEGRRVSREAWGRHCPLHFVCVQVRRAPHEIQTEVVAGIGDGNRNLQPHGVPCANALTRLQQRRSHGLGRTVPQPERCPFQRGTRPGGLTRKRQPPIPSSSPTTRVRRQRRVQASPPTNPSTRAAQTAICSSADATHGVAPPRSTRQVHW